MLWPCYGWGYNCQLKTIVWTTVWTTTCIWKMPRLLVVYLLICLPDSVLVCVHVSIYLSTCRRWPYRNGIITADQRIGAVGINCYKFSLRVTVVQISFAAAKSPLPQLLLPTSTTQGVISRSLSTAAASTLVHAFVVSRLDYCSAI